jgi:hypothetical protein
MIACCIYLEIMLTNNNINDKMITDRSFQPNQLNMHIQVEALPHSKLMNVYAIILEECTVLSNRVTNWNTVWNWPSFCQGCFDFGQ